MCQLLIRVYPRGEGRLSAFFAGDVIYVAGDEHVFSPAELRDPFRVVRVPGIPVESMEQYLLGNKTARRSQGFDISGALGGLLMASSGEVLTLTGAAAWELLQVSVER